jgi:cyclopropane fatty-acyl-phospholipid synthase-like methyltransferase
LNCLLNFTSKHSHYQEIYSEILKKVSLDNLPEFKKRDLKRFNHMKKLINFDNAKVLDIGANIGFFSIASLDSGAREVVAYEPNSEQANFIKISSKLIGKEESLMVHNTFYDFEKKSVSNFDVILCLNVLHHIGDDFGDKNIPLNEAKKQIQKSIRSLSETGNKCYFQLGYNWKGDRNKPLFELGSKNEMIDFVYEACEQFWDVVNVSIYDPVDQTYSDKTTELMERFETCGEFLNRPIFLLKSKNVID